MKSSGAILLVAVIFAGLTFGMAIASGPGVVSASVYFHGDFASNSESCSSCHRVHFADASNLLTYGPTETDFCYYCHGEGRATTSGYDVETGMITGGGIQRPSYAGGFKLSIDPSRSYVANKVYENTSVHSIEKAMRMGNLSELKDGNIPGMPEGVTWKGSFKCGSCHDPHGGGKYPATPYRNPRLLRSTLLDSTKRYVYMYIDYGQTNLPLEYGAGFNQWCGGCHNVFNTEGSERTGTTGYSNNSVMKFRHKMGVNIPEHVFSTALGTGLPIPTDTKGDNSGNAQWKLSCITCHRAHGSSVHVSVGFKRFTTYNSVYSYGNDEIQSALLRLPEREACVRCHGSAEYNKYDESKTPSEKYGTGW